MRNLFLLCYLLTSIPLFSQVEDSKIYTVNGRIVEEHNNIALELATITFTDQKSDAIYRAISDSKGRFEIELKAGDYNITASYISYLDTALTLSNLKENTDLGTLIMKSDVKALDEITIASSSDQVTIKPNQITYNITKDISADGSSASEVLSNIPTLSTDAAGKVFFRGTTNASVLINGKTSSIDVKSIPASSIACVEVITNPGASTRARDLAIVNIVLKKGKDEGLTSSITASGGYKEDYGALLNISNKTKKTNVYSNISYFKRLRAKNGEFKNTYFDNGTPESFLYEDNHSEEMSEVFYGNIGMDFYISDYVTLGGSINYSKIDTDGDLFALSEWKDANNMLLELNERNNTRYFDNEILEYFLDFKSVFKNGNEFTFNFQHRKDDERYENEFINSNPNFIEDDFVEKNTLNNSRVRLKYKSNSKAGVFTFGYEGEFGSIPFTFKTDSNFESIEYSEYVNAFYVDYEWETAKMYYGVGVRTELTDTEIDYKTDNSKVDKIYENFFPSLYIDRSLSDNQSLSLYYNRKIIRPSYPDLQPFEHKFSESSSYMGNVDLNPSYWDTYNLSYTYFKSKFSLSPTAYFNRITDYPQLVTKEVAGPTGTKFVSSPQNVGYLNQYGVNIVMTYDAAKWLDFTLSANVYGMLQKGTFTYLGVDDEQITLDFENDQGSGDFGLLTKINISDKLSLQSLVKHELKSVGAQSERLARTWANFALSQELFKGNGTLSLNVNDVFNTRYTTERNLFDENYYQRGRVENDFQSVIMSFTYRFNQSKKDRKIDFSKKEEIEKYIP